MIYSVQYMRAIASLMVLVHHASWKSVQYSHDLLTWFNIGSAGVDLFFIISGFIMCQSLENKEVKVLTFIKNRVTRIIPLYWLLTSVALAIFIFFPDKVNSSGGETSILHSYLLFPSEYKFLIQNGWTLSFEFLFYFIFSTSLFIRSSVRYIVPVLLINLLALIGYLFSFENYTLKFLTNPLLLEFSWGIIAFYFYRACACGIKIGLFLLTISLALLITVNFSNSDGATVFRLGLPVLLFFMGMLLLEPYFYANSHRFKYRILRNLGDSSYSLYLFHPFCLAFSSILLTYIGINDFSFLFLLLIVVFSVISGHLCFMFVEKKLTNLLHISGSKRKIITI